MMGYHAIGKEEWEALPNIFSDPELARTLDVDANFWCYTYMFPSTAQPGKHCVIEAGVSYSRLTSLFTKYIRSAGVINV